MMKSSINKVRISIGASPFTRAELNELLDLGEKGIKQMIQIQKEALKLDALWIGTGEEK